MKFALIGGDRRSVLLAGLLAREGHSVRCFAMEKAENGSGVIKTGCIQGCTYGADCVILPVPTLKGGLLNAPYCAQELTLPELSPALWSGQRLFGGGLPEEFRLNAIQSGLSVHDFLDRRDFAMGNAAITAEAAVSIIMQAEEHCISGSRVVITGWGRIAKFLALKLAALGAELIIAARSSSARVEAECLGMSSCRLENLHDFAADCDCLINTVPAQIIGSETSSLLNPTCVILELASAPGGFGDSSETELVGRIIKAPGLPGKYAPQSAAKLMRDTIFEIIGEDDF